MFSDDLTSLKAFLETLEKQFLENLLQDPLADSEKCDVPVRAYCVLAHAAFEEFFETFSRKVLDLAITKFKHDGEITKPLLLLIKLCPDNFKIDFENDSDFKGPFDYVKDYLEKAKTWFSREILDNHGISSKYLKKIFFPLYINISCDPNFKNSLSQLANFRGEFAHKKIAKKVLDPNLARQFVSDVYSFSEQLSKYTLT